MQITKLFEQVPILKTNVSETLEIDSVWSDSRKIKKGSAFVCLKGTKYDGYMWIDSALENGAAVVVCEEIPEKEIPFVQVADTRSALPLLLAALYGHPERSFRKIIAITGTNGKTTTSFMLKAIFEEAGVKTGLIGTTKYLIGNEEYQVEKSEAFLTTPDPELFFALLSAMRDAEVDTVIMEASSHALYLKKLSGIHFDIGIFSNLTQDHIDFHKTMEDYLAAKKILFQHCDIGVFNADDPHFEAMTSGVSCKVKSYSAVKNADFTALNAAFKDPKGISYTLSHDGKEQEIFVGIPGKFTVYNSLAASAAALCAGIGADVVAKALLKMEGVKGRIEKIPVAAPFSVFIDFAHTPDALENILKTLREFTKGRLVTLFGCGGDRDKAKRPIMGKIACEMSDFVIITSDNSRSEEKEDIIRDILVGVEGTGTPHVTICDRTEAIHYALSHAKEGDVILLAGKGHEEYEIDKTGKHEYSERKIVLEYMGARS